MRVTLLAVVAAALVLPAAVQAATTNFTIPIEFDIAACNGDTIELSGQLLGVFTATANSAGGFLLATQVEPQGVRGVDLQTGTKFRGTGVTRDMTVVSASA